MQFSDQRSTDDLDSQTVYEEVVKLVRKIKPNRQFIFATHNANFPVLGDAEIVAACAYEEKISVMTGSIDTKEAQGKVVSIMEGGKEAFARRKTIYEIWDATESYAGAPLSLVSPLPGSRRLSS